VLVPVPVNLAWSPPTPWQVVVYESLANPGLEALLTSLPLPTWVVLFSPSGARLSLPLLEARHGGQALAAVRLVAIGGATCHLSPATCHLSPAPCPRPQHLHLCAAPGPPGARGGGRPLPPGPAGGPQAGLGQDHFPHPTVDCG